MGKQKRKKKWLVLNRSNKLNEKQKINYVSNKLNEN